jgi:hypothetical protein
MSMRWRGLRNGMEGHNTILPDFNFQEIATEIERRNKHYDYKGIARGKIKALPKDPILRIDSLLNFYYKNDLFQGVELIKKGEEVYFEKGYGFANE